MGEWRAVRELGMDTRLRTWPGYAAVFWGIVFAVPSFVWANGGTFGATTTVSPALVRLAQDRVPWFVAVLWLTAFLKLFGAAVGFGLTRLRGKGLSRFLVFCGSGAAVLLIWHGLLFVIGGILIVTGVLPTQPDLLNLTHWYLYLWGPWFVLGGLAFALATVQHTRRHPDRRVLRIFVLVAGIGAALVSLAALLGGVG